MKSRTVTITLGAVADKHPPKGATSTPVLHFAYCADLEGREGREVSLLAANMARGVINRISGDDPQGIMEGWPEEKDYRHLWHIDIRITMRTASRADLDADYRAMPDCPLDQRGDMMQIYRALCKAMREGGR